MSEKELQDKIAESVRKCTIECNNCYIDSKEYGRLRYSSISIHLELLDKACEFYLS